ncbi:hypothetical protein CDAR_562401 [Caerostris darwini]|uniref:Uncharacterized protein n=1 Tax=Caerostris darwini TaxID=1538125 RepID=A0AAV4X990_9ARAC|nr:hypothetical protein CDAR_562401 [Caerostris darwini]
MQDVLPQIASFLKASAPSTDCNLSTRHHWSHSLSSVVSLPELSPKQRGCRQEAPRRGCQTICPLTRDLSTKVSCRLLLDFSRRALHATHKQVAVLVVYFSYFFPSSRLDPHDFKNIV